MPTKNEENRIKIIDDSIIMYNHCWKSVYESRKKESMVMFFCDSRYVNRSLIPVATVMFL